MWETEIQESGSRKWFHLVNREEGKAYTLAKIDNLDGGWNYDLGEHNLDSSLSGEHCDLLDRVCVCSGRFIWRQRNDVSDVEIWQYLFRVAKVGE
jgi:hypothetical protein